MKTYPDTYRRQDKIQTYINELLKDINDIRLKALFDLDKADYEDFKQAAREMME